MNFSNITNASFSAENVSTQLTQMSGSSSRGNYLRIIVPFQFCLAVTGIITNGINIRVFVEQGVRNSNTIIGLFSLSAFDFFGCFFLITPSFCLVFRYINDVYNLRVCRAYMTIGGYPYIVFYYCSIWTTVYLSLERTLCVVMPMKVKQFLRPKVAIITLASMFVFFSTIQVIYSANTRVVWRFDRNLNRSVPYISDSGFAKNYLYYYSLFANTSLSTIAVIIVAINTVILISKLNGFSKWRLEHSGGNAVSSDKRQNPKISTKDAELVKSVIIVTVVFLVCISISHIPATALLLVPGFSFSGSNSYLFQILYTVRIIFSTVNSSVNFFFYIHLSGRYKTAFAAVYPRCSRNLNNAE